MYFSKNNIFKHNINNNSNIINIIYNNNKFKSMTKINNSFNNFRYYSTNNNNNNNNNNNFFKNYILNSNNLKFKERKELIESFIPINSQGNLIKDKIYNDIGLSSSSLSSSSSSTSSSTSLEAVINNQQSLNDNNNNSNNNISIDILESFIKIRDDLERYILEVSLNNSGANQKSSVLNQGIIEFDIILGELIKENLKNNDHLYCKPLDINSMQENVWRSIIENEAVHPYRDLSNPIDEILNRTTNNRICLVLFHPRLPSLPLMSLYIAFTSGIPDNIPSIELNDINDKSNNQDQIDSAIFYSISSLHKGLGGVNLGHILITKAVEYIKSNYLNISNFCTLSPLPRFKKYLSKNHPHIVEKIKNKESIHQLKNDLEYLALNYIYTEKSKQNRVYDPVCNFHLKNGACIYRLNWNADPSEKRFEESYGIMINYLYDIENLKRNSKDYTNSGYVTTHSIFNNQFKNSKF